jgi:hypothetical protein
MCIYVTYENKTIVVPQYMKPVSCGDLLDLIIKNLLIHNSVSQLANAVFEMNLFAGSFDEYGY